MAGQMIVVGFSGDSSSDEGVAAITAEIANSEIGGVMYLKPNIADLDAVRSMNAAFLAASPEDLPPFIAIDQEGGSIERLTRAVGFPEIQSAADIARGMSPESALRIYTGMARDLAMLGFNLNFGPVVDLNINPTNPIIGNYGRAFGPDAATVVSYASAFIEAHRRADVLTALKHFPGHGSSSTDSHEGFVDITGTWQPEELEPYRALVSAGMADMVMVGHLFHEKFVTEQGVQPPSSLSPSWITGVLRAQLGFHGVVISDDMEMSAVREQFGFRDAILRAVRAGVDVLLFSNTADYRAGLADEIRRILVAEAEADPAFRARIEESYMRISAVKQRLAG